MSGEPGHPNASRDALTLPVSALLCNADGGHRHLCSQMIEATKPRSSRTARATELLQLAREIVSLIILCIPFLAGRLL